MKMMNYSGAYESWIRMNRVMAKKIIPVLRVAVIFISVFYLYGMAPPAGDVMLSLSSGEGAPGSSVTLSLNLAYPGEPQAAGLNLDISYKSAVLENPSVLLNDALKKTEIDKMIIKSDVVSEDPSMKAVKILVFGQFAG